MHFSGRRMWLIGASTGSGAALAPDLAREGVLLAISRSEAELNSVADKAARFDDRPVVRPLDVTASDAMKRVQAEVTAALGRIDVLFYNTGTWLQASVEEFDSDKAACQVEANLIDMMRAVRTGLPEKRNREIVGMARYRGYPRTADFSSSKAG